MPEPVTVPEVQENALEITFDLQRLIQRLHHQHNGLRGSYEDVAKSYETDEPSKDRPSLELAVTEEVHTAANDLTDVAERLLKRCRLTDFEVREKWRLKAKR